MSGEWRPRRCHPPRPPGLPPLQLHLRPPSPAPLSVACTPRPVARSVLTPRPSAPGPDHLQFSGAPSPWTPVHHLQPVPRPRCPRASQPSDPLAGSPDPQLGNPPCLGANSLPDPLSPGSSSGRPAPPSLLPPDPSPPVAPHTRCPLATLSLLTPEPRALVAPGPRRLFCSRFVFLVPVMPPALSPDASLLYRSFPVTLFSTPVLGSRILVVYCFSYSGPFLFFSQIVGGVPCPVVPAFPIHSQAEPLWGPSRAAPPFRKGAAGLAGRLRGAGGVRGPPAPASRKFSASTWPRGLSPSL